MDNMRYYEKCRSVPQDALKSFNNGRFSGTDINPMWRIKKLTEMFGPCGIGWYTEVTRQEVVSADEGNMMVFVDLNLYVKEGDQWSKPIFGTGGNTLKVKGKSDDEGYKKAYTDAMSIACKALGIGADVWYANDTTSKYSDKYTDATTGSAEAAREAGQKKLEEINAKLAQAAQNPSQAAEDDRRVPATEKQKEFIKNKASDADYMSILDKYGADMERLSKAGAKKVIDKIIRNNGGASA